ncbi:hypothetical protein HQ533_05755 [Candidatus Woesearchaeota archaeon]|nr:hypothetical protein [Candidatus Woesearchaeota archaeon]
MNPFEFLPFSPFLFVLVIIALVFGLAYYFDKKRRQAMSEEAVRIGFSFEPKGDDGFVEKLLVFKSFKKGHRHRAKNVLKGRRNSLSWSIFDYRYSVGYGKHSRTYNQTVAMVNLGIMAPSFYLTKGSFLHKLGSTFGYRDIDFESNPEFSKKYYLSGQDEQAIRKLFSSNILNFFGSVEVKFTVEAEGDKLVVFRPNKKVKPVEIDDYIQDASKIVTVFQRELERGQ